MNKFFKIDVPEKEMTSNQYVLSRESKFGIYRDFLFEETLSLHELAGNIKFSKLKMPTEQELGFALLRLYQEGLIGMTTIPPQNFNAAGQVYIKINNLFENVQDSHPMAGIKVFLPEFKHGKKEDAGADVRAIGDVIIPVDGVALVSLGFSMEIPVGYEVQVRPRSGLARRGIVVPNAPGTIDSGYRGECMVLLRNDSSEPFRIKAGDRIAQFVLNKVPVANYYFNSELSKSKRGLGGFGSTGIK